MHPYALSTYYKTQAFESKKDSKVFFLAVFSKFPCHLSKGHFSRAKNGRFFRRKTPVFLPLNHNILWFHPHFTPVHHNVSSVPRILHVLRQ